MTAGDNMTAAHAAPKAHPSVAADDTNGELTVGELAQRCVTSVSALRFYERQGLLAPWRTAGNKRRYPATDVHRVRVIIAARATGYAVPDIRALLASLPTDRAPTDDEWAGVIANWRAGLTDHIARLQRLRDQTTACASRRDCFDGAACRLALCTAAEEPNPDRRQSSSRMVAARTCSPSATDAGACPVPEPRSNGGSP